MIPSVCDRLQRSQLSKETQIQRRDASLGSWTLTSLGTTEGKSLSSNTGGKRTEKGQELVIINWKGLRLYRTVISCTAKRQKGRRERPGHLGET